MDALLFYPGCGRGRSLRVRPRSISAPLPPFGEAGWTRSGRPQLSKSLICESPQGRSLRVHPPSFCAPHSSSGVLREGGVFHLILKANPGGEAFEYTRRRFAPPFCMGVLRKGRVYYFRCTWTTLFHVMKQIRIIVWIFGCTLVSCTGFFFDGRIITRKTRKSHRNTENLKNRLDGPHVVPSPAPTRNPRKSTEFTKRGQGWGEAFEYTRSRIAPPFFWRVGR
jgi:hypothetical protein